MKYILEDNGYNYCWIRAFIKIMKKMGIYIIPLYFIMKKVAILLNKFPLMGILLNFPNIYMLRCMCEIVQLFSVAVMEG